MAFIDSYTSLNDSSSITANGSAAFARVVATNVHIVASNKSEEYDPAMGQAILRAKKAPAVVAPAGEKEFLDWLNQP